jgi:hypothetical protein
MSFMNSDLFGSDNRPLYPSAYDYYRTPSLENAKRFLDDSGIYVPYEATLFLAEAAGTVIPETASAGSVSRYRYYEDLSGSDSDSDSNSGSYEELPETKESEADGIADNFAIFHRASFLYHTHPPGLWTSTDIAYRILNIGIRIPELLKQRLWKNSREVKPLSYARAATKTLEEHFGLSRSILRVERVWKYNEEGLKIHRDHQTADAYMHQTVANWLTPNEAGVAEIVLDGILEDQVTQPIRKGIHEEYHLRSLAMCAFLQWMIGEWPEPNGTGGGLREIRFLTGSFQTTDVGAHKLFLNRWVDELARNGTALKSVGSVRVVRMEVLSVPAGVPDVAMIPGDNAALLVRGRRVPFVGEVPPPSAWPYPNTDEADLAYRFGNFLANEPVHQVIYTGCGLANMSRDYSILVPSQQVDPFVQNSIEQALAVNAFRDAFKADVALSRGAVYITTDRLSLLYYEMRRRALGAANRGLSVILGESYWGITQLKTYHEARAV